MFPYNVSGARCEPCTRFLEAQESWARCENDNDTYCKTVFISTSVILSGSFVDTWDFKMLTEKIGSRTMHVYLVDAGVEYLTELKYPTRGPQLF